METTKLVQKVKQTFGRNYSNPIIEHLQNQGVKPLSNDSFTKKIIQDIVNKRCNHLEAENEILNLLLAKQQQQKSLEKKMQKKLNSLS